MMPDNPWQLTADALPPEGVHVDAYYEENAPTHSMCRIGDVWYENYPTYRLVDSPAPLMWRHKTERSRIA
jgi:hypothetical protein